MPGRSETETMTRTEIERAREYINSRIASANWWHDRTLSLDGRIDAAEDVGNAEQAAKLERMQDRAIRERDDEIAAARVAEQVIVAMGYRPIREEYTGGRYFEQVEEIVTQAVWESLY